MGAGVGGHESEHMLERHLWSMSAEQIGTDINLLKGWELLTKPGHTITPQKVWRI